MTTITDQIGRELAGRYRLEAGLGTGASAHVFAATDLRLRRRVAVKLLHPGLSGDAAFLRRFGAEAQAVAALHHPNILQVFDWGEEDGGPFIVLEYLAGGSLRDLLDSGARLSVAQTVGVGTAAARGLAYAHRRGLVHRDVKPANILFDEDGGVRIADFGLARALAEAAWTEPAGAILGTARYASPEQAEGRRLDERSDVYSLALVCYEAVTGKVPFSGETTFSTLMARVGAVLPPSPALGPLAPILAQAAISEPLARLDADELAANLELLGRTLAAPGPLPLAPRALLRSPALPARPGPPESPVHAARGVDPGGPGRQDARDALAVAPAGSRSGPGEENDEVDGDGPSARPRKRRRAYRAVLVLTVAIVILGVAAAVKMVAFSRTVPRLVGTVVSTARTEAAAAGLRLRVVGRRYSTSAGVGAVLSEHPAAGSKEAPGSTVSVVVSKGGPPVRVPLLVGRGRSAAVALVRAAHLEPVLVPTYSESVARGTVLGTVPASGLVAYAGPLRVEVSRGPRPVTVPILGPGESWPSASGALVGLRLRPTETLVYSDTVPSGSVITTSPVGGTPGVAVGTTVVVTVSRGPKLVSVPTVAGDTIGGAVTALRDAGLVVTEQIGPPFATKATTTNPGPGSDVRPGSDVTLYVA